MTYGGTKRVWLLARSASASQSGGRPSAQDQLDRLTHYASAQGWKIVGKTAETLPDGLSRRSQFAALLEVAESKPKQFDILLVESLSRLSRDVLKLNAIMRRLGNAEIEVRTSGGRGSPIIDILAELSAHSGHPNQEKVRRFRIRAAEQGNWIHPAPFGYLKVRRSDGCQILAVNEDEARVVRQAFYRAFGHNERPRTIVRRLNEGGCRTRRGRQWSVSQILRVLENPAYTGNASVKIYSNIYSISASVNEIKIQIPPLVSRHKFLEVQRILRDLRSRLARRC